MEQVCSQEPFIIIITWQRFASSKIQWSFSFMPTERQKDSSTHQSELQFYISSLKACQSSRHEHFLFTCCRCSLLWESITPVVYMYTWSQLVETQLGLSCWRLHVFNVVMYEFIQGRLNQEILGLAVRSFPASLMPPGAPGCCMTVVGNRNQSKYHMGLWMDDGVLLLPFWLKFRHGKHKTVWYI